MKPEDETNEVYRFFTEVGIINQLISTKLEAFLPGRMTATQFGILGHLVRRPEGETPLQLSNAFQVPKTSMTHKANLYTSLKRGGCEKSNGRRKNTLREHIYLLTKGFVIDTLRRVSWIRLIPFDHRGLADRAFRSSMHRCQNGEVKTCHCHSRCLLELPEERPSARQPSHRHSGEKYRSLRTRDHRARFGGNAE